MADGIKSAVYCQLIPLQEMTPGAVGAIRNQVVSALVFLVSQELNMAPDKLVCRDVRPASDLAMYAGGTTTSTVDEWLYDATTTTANAFTAVSAAATMGDQRYVALFGVRDIRGRVGVHSTAMGVALIDTGGGTDYTARPLPAAVVSFIQLQVGGANKVIWDVNSIESYDTPVGFSPSPVVIKQNVSYQIQYLFNTTIAGLRTWLQLIGIVCEPRGRTITP